MNTVTRRGHLRRPARVAMSRAHGSRCDATGAGALGAAAAQENATAAESTPLARLGAGAFGLGGQLGDGGEPQSRPGDRRWRPRLRGHRRRTVRAAELRSRRAGAAWCWGPGGGRLGNGSTDVLERAGQGVVTAAVRLEVGAGEPHACALDPAGQAWCWGRNATASWVSGAPAIRPWPRRPWRADTTSRQLAVGGQFNCALTPPARPGAGAMPLEHRRRRGDRPRRADCCRRRSCLRQSVGQLRPHLRADGGRIGLCWGSVWALGSGNEDQRYLPIEVVGGHQFNTVKAGGTATCGITTAGAPMCWGGNSRGKVGQSNVDR